MELTDNVSKVKGIGPALTNKFENIGINTVRDMLEYFPRRYDDYSNAINIIDLAPGLVTLEVKFENIKSRRVKRGLHITDADAVDDTGKVKVVWFNQPYRPSSLKGGQVYLLHGSYDYNNNRLQIVNPSIEQKSISKTEKSIVPTYPERAGLKSNIIKKAIYTIISNSPKIKEILPKNITKEYDLPSLEWAYRQIHSPDSDSYLTIAKRRFAFDELFIIMLAANKIKLENQQIPAKPIEFKEEVAREFVSNLPFKLTDSQRKVVWQIYNNMANETAMNRLVEGDVGSGKTVVAAMAALMSLEAGQQVAFIAPTEILARQHYETINQLLSHTKYSKKSKLLVGSITAKNKQAIKEDINNHDAVLLVGTHALFEESVNWADLGLIIIDEQHRFGVNQRQSLHAKSKYMPHVLCLTATPIPRSLALTVYGELDISILEKPPLIKAGSQTSLVSPNSTAQMYEEIKGPLVKGRQAYIVCPLITESDVLMAHSAETVYKTLKQKELKDFKLGLLHGKLKAKEKDEIMNEFKAGNIDVLVTTTVIEVGVDVKNATEMVILNADRFGLAQLHQLRGRVGRGEHLGHCYLVLSDSKKPTKRMQVIESNDDGFKLAEFDMEIRGPGAIYGTRQHGELDLRHVSLTDHKLIAEVRQAVTSFSKSGENVLKYKELSDKLNRTLKLTYLN